eukprot:2388043-Alexandrium_andersonii.AAC.1
MKTALRCSALRPAAQPPRSRARSLWLLTMVAARVWAKAEASLEQINMNDEAVAAWNELMHLFRAE